jgi:tagatose kinase
MAEIVVVGEILVEIMATEIGQTFLRPGLFRGPYPSGAPAIFADQAARTGAKVALVGSVGKDDFGTVNLRRLQASGVDTSCVKQHPDWPTGSAFVTYASDGSRSFVFNIARSAAGCASIDQLDPALFTNCRFFHIMGSSLISAQMTQTIRHGIDLAKAAGAEISFDPNVRKELCSNPVMLETVQEILGKTDILLPSEDDLRLLFPESTELDAIQHLLRSNIHLILLKRGQNGSTYFDRAGKIDVPPVVADEVDPTGAGDCFGGTFISCLVQKIPLQDALTLASAAGSLAVRTRGPMEGNSTLEQLKTYLEGAGGSDLTRNIGRI